MAENAAGVSASRPLLEGALLNEYRFKWIAFPAVKGYLLSRDYEYQVQTSETMIDLAAIRLMINRIASA